jgi:hypothetical protein
VLPGAFVLPGNGNSREGNSFRRKSYVTRSETGDLLQPEGGKSVALDVAKALQSDQVALFIRIPATYNCGGSWTVLVIRILTLDGVQKLGQSSRQHTLVFLVADTVGKLPAELER